jgi:hypothetical protein
MRPFQWRFQFANHSVQDFEEIWISSFNIFSCISSAHPNWQTLKHAFSFGNRKKGVPARDQV